MGGGCDASGGAATWAEGGLPKQRREGFMLFASQTDEDVTFMFNGAGFE